MKTIVLLEPIKIKKFIGSTLLSVITVREPKVKDIYGLDFSPQHQAKSMITIISRLSGVKEDDLNNLSVTDFTRIVEVVNKSMVGA